MSSVIVEMADHNNDQRAGGDTNENYVDDATMDELQSGCHREEFKEMKEVSEMILSLKDTFQDQVLRETALERFIFIVDQYQEQPHLLDPHLNELLEMLLKIARDPKSHRDLVHLVFKYMYYVTKTRGYKVILRLMPHEVVDLEPILNLLQEQNLDDAETWETRYMLLVWLSIVCMIPFDIDRLNQNQGGATEVIMMDRILDAGKAYLGVFDKSRDAASYLIARFLTRPDVKEKRLQQFVDWATKVLDKVNTGDMKDMCSIYGLLNTFGLLFKHGKREDLLDIAPILLKKLEDLKLMKSNTGLRKLHIKVIQRLGLGFLKPRLASWRYQRGNRSLVENLVKKSESAEVGSKNTVLADDDDDDYDIPEELESIIEELLGGLRDKDTIVRWSAAKGIGRLSGRLPRELADEVLGSILELFSDLAGDEPWHGGCLALAELGRRGLLLPDRLTDVIPIVLKALTYDEKRGNFSVGSHVRDAACYVCWAFARAYDPAEIAPYVQQIAGALVICSVLDRDINVRRAAAAAFQENVGRQGQFPHGIDILTTCDYFAVGSRARCYKELSLFIGKFPEYINALVDHLVEVKLVHWDVMIRELSGKALERLCSLAPDYLATKILPMLIAKTLSYDLAIRHGTTLGLAYIIDGLTMNAQKTGKPLKLSKDVKDAIETIVEQQTEANLYKGISGASLRTAAAYLVQMCSKSKITVPEKVVKSWLNFIDDCLYHLDANVRQSAVDAVPVFIGQYISRDKCEPIIEKYLRELTNPVETTRMGFALAIGGLPKFALIGTFKAVTCSLINCITSQKLPAREAEGRRDAVKALAEVCCTVGVEITGSPQTCICSANVNEIYDTIFTALKDYTIDSARGDVGSWVREAAMNALGQVTSLVLKAGAAKLITPVIAENIFCLLLQQGNEKIGRTRGIAGDNFMLLLHHDPPVPGVPDHKLLKDLFLESAYAPSKKLQHRSDHDIVWELPSRTCTLFAKLLVHPIYVKPVLLGFVVSVGGLTEHLVLHSRTALFQQLKLMENDRKAMDLFTETLLGIFNDYQKQNRVIIPALKMLDQLLDNNCFAWYTENESEFPMRLYNALKNEMTNIGEPAKLLAAVDVYCGMIQFTGETRKKVLFSLMMLLCHKYPRIRKKVANKLYETLLMYDDITEDENMDEANVLLSETLWDNDLNEVRPIRNNLCDLLHISRPVMKNANK